MIKKQTGLRKTLMIAGGLLAIVPTIFLGLLCYLAVDSQMKQDYEIQLHQGVQMGLQNLQTAQDLSLDKLNSDLSLAEDFYLEKGQWAVNQTGQLVLKTSEAEDKVLSLDEKLIDKISALTSGAVTIFQLQEFSGIKDQDEISKTWTQKDGFYRISTSVRKKDGKRALGTLVSLPVYECLKRGETYRGRAWVVDQWYTTAYKPFFNSDSKLIGALFVGVPEVNYQKELINQLAKVTLGYKASFFILDSQGKFLLNRKEKTDLESVQKFLNTAKKLKNAETRLVAYNYGKDNLFSEQNRVVELGYFAPWDWALGVGADESDLRSGVNSIRNLSLFIALVAILIALILTFIMASKIVNPLIQVKQVAQRISQGDFQIPALVVHGKDETAALAQAFNEIIQSLKEKNNSLQYIAQGLLTHDIPLSSQEDTFGQSMNAMQESLKELLKHVIFAVGQVTQSSQQVSQASQSLSQGSVEQATSIQEITQVAQKIYEQASINANNIVQAKQVSQEAYSKAISGTDLMTNLSSQMDQIAKESEKTRMLVKAIDDIAFQTNLLALNANIEAARTGKHGLGFHVVAEEIRNLAVRSADAVNEADQVVEGITKAALQGVATTAQVRSELTKILEKIQISTTLMDSINQSGQQETKELAAVSHLLNNIEKVTHSNSSGSEETAAAAMELSTQALELQKIVSKFQLKSS